MANVYQFKDFEGSSHRILIRLIRQFSTTRGTLLDLGAAGGELGLAIRDDFDRTLGIEYDPDNAGRLKRCYSQVVIGDLERIDRLPRSVQAVVLADVLEHLRDPGRTLRMVREALDPDGHIFVSVPNIANVTTRLGLLFGIFKYRDRGILDATHLRFYTLSTIREEIEKAGLEVLVIRGSAIPVRLIVGGRFPEPVLRLGESVLARSTQLWRKLLAYQIIMVARART